MKKHFLFILFMAIIGAAKSQSIIIYATEKIKGAEIPVTRTDFTITINDSITRKLTSQNDGSLPRIPVINGTHKVVISGEEFNDSVENNVIVKDYRTTEITMYVSRKNVPKASAKEKK